MAVPVPEGRLADRRCGSGCGQRRPADRRPGSAHRPVRPAAPGYQHPARRRLPRFRPRGYQVPPAGYQALPAGYQVPPGGYQVPMAGYQGQVRMNPGHARGLGGPGTRGRRAGRPAFAEGRLTQDEYNDRMGRAYAARTYGELTALTADLPAGPCPTAWPVPVYQPPVSTNSLARASLVLGVAEFFTMGLTAIPAIICGHMAKHEMRQTGQRGDGLATSGLVLGYMAVIFWGILIALSIVGAVISASGDRRLRAVPAELRI